MSNKKNINTDYCFNVVVIDNCFYVIVSLCAPVDRARAPSCVAASVNSRHIKFLTGEQCKEVDASGGNMRAPFCIPVLHAAGSGVGACARTMDTSGMQRGLATCFTQHTGRVHSLLINN